MSFPRGLKSKINFLETYLLKAPWKDYSEQETLLSSGKLSTRVPGASVACTFGFHFEDGMSCRHTRPRRKPEAKEKNNPNTAALRKWS